MLHSLRKAPILRYPVLLCCSAAVLLLNNLTAVLPHGITAALCLMGYLSLLSLLSSPYVSCYELRVSSYELLIPNSAFRVSLLLTAHLPLATCHLPLLYTCLLRDDDGVTGF